MGMEFTTSTPLTGPSALSSGQPESLSTHRPTHGSSKRRKEPRDLSWVQRLEAAHAREQHRHLFSEARRLLRCGVNAHGLAYIKN
jgi:IS5 family transposase